MLTLLNVEGVLTGDGEGSKYHHLVEIYTRSCTWGEPLLITIDPFSEDTVQEAAETQSVHALSEEGLWLEAYVCHDTLPEKMRDEHPA